MTQNANENQCYWKFCALANAENRFLLVSQGIQRVHPGSHNSTVADGDQGIRSKEYPD
jgi:hypothetical protein